MDSDFGEGGIYRLVTLLGLVFSFQCSCISQWGRLIALVDNESSKILLMSVLYLLQSRLIYNEPSISIILGFTFSLSQDTKMSLAM